MLLAIALMLLTANVAAPLLIWLGSALLSATLAASSIVPSARSRCWRSVLAFVVWAACTHRATVHREMAHWRLNAYPPLAERQVLERASPRATPGTRELTAEDLAHLRFALDRGLQPAESLEGFDVIEQFQTSSVRYQINNLLWALQIAQMSLHAEFPRVSVAGAAQPDRQAHGSEGLEVVAMGEPVGQFQPESRPDRQGQHHVRRVLERPHRAVHREHRR